MTRLLLIGSSRPSMQQTDAHLLDNSTLQERLPLVGRCHSSMLQMDAWVISNKSWDRNSSILHKSIFGNIKTISIISGSHSPISQEEHKSHLLCGKCSGFMAPSSLNSRQLSHCDIYRFEDLVAPNSFIYRTLSWLTLSNDFLYTVVAEMWGFWIGEIINSTAPP